jgi:hypothetical protein
LIFTCDTILRFQTAFGAKLTLPIQGFFNALVYFHGTRKQQPRRSGTAEQGPRSSFISEPPFQPWWSFRRLLSGKRSISSSESIAAAQANDVMAEEEELQDSEEKDPVVEPIDSASRK